MFRSWNLNTAQGYIGHNHVAEKYGSAVPDLWLRFVHARLHSHAVATVAGATITTSCITN